ncbi:MAG: energy transducer TonB [Acidobacteria bacterium]|nr:energy transducer TonB [Acidobacteriota bacterium]
MTRAIERLLLSLAFSAAAMALPSQERPEAARTTQKDSPQTDAQKPPADTAKTQETQRVYRVGEGVTAPQVIKKLDPHYSEEALRARRQGTVELYVEIEPDGKAHNIQVRRGLGLGLDEKAIEAVRKWKFKPGMKEGHPVTVRATVAMGFLATSKDEDDLFSKAANEPDPARKLKLLDKWKQKYPQTLYDEARLRWYMKAFEDTGQGAAAVQTANELLALAPDDFLANHAIATQTPFLGSTDQEARENAGKAAGAVLRTADQEFASNNKPPNVSDGDWAGRKNMALATAHRALGWVAMTEKKNETAEQEFLKTLELNLSAAQVSLWLGNVTMAQNDPEKQTLALFSLARAAAYDGPSGLKPQDRQRVEASLANAYRNYHGEDQEGLAELKRLAKDSPLPPDGFIIKPKEEARAKE